MITELIIKWKDRWGRKRDAVSQSSGRHAPHPFWVMVSKEISDHVRSWRFIILFALISLTCLASLYSALKLFYTVNPEETDSSFLFLKLFTVSDGTLPSFISFVGFLAPLLGIGMGFDAINSEQNKGTLSRLLAQPVHRDYIINAKFLSSFIIISIMFTALALLVTGMGMIMIGIPPTPSEVWRMIFFIVLTVCYVGFWLNLSILCSIRFRQAATSALTAIAVWIFFSIFYNLIMNLVADALQPKMGDTVQQMISNQELLQNLMRLSPNQLFNEGTTTLLMPSVRSLGPLTVDQVYGAIPSPLSLGQSLLLVWPQITGLIAATIACFALSYYLFMRKEIRGK